VSSDEKLQAIYDAEINLNLSWFWDAGVNVVIGDNVNGYRALNNLLTVKEAIDWAYEWLLTEKAKR